MPRVEAARAPAAPRALLQLQRALGNGAVQRLLAAPSGRAAPRAPVSVTPRPGTAPGAVQRAVILLDVNPDDYALQKVLTGLDAANLRLVDGGGPARALNTGAGQKALIPFAALDAVADVALDRVEDDPQAMLRNGEDVYIVGHGAAGGSVWTAPDHGGATGDFSGIVATIRAMAGPNWTGSIRVMTCNSEVQGGRNQASVTEKIADEWGDGAPAITGQAGFAYGMGMHQPGTMAVLKTEFESLYKGDDFDADTAQHLYDAARADADVADLINFSPNDRQLYPTAAAKRIGAWDAFVAKMRAIEVELKGIVDRNNTNGVRGLASLAKAQALRTHVRFQQLIAEQHALFAAFDLWA